MKLHYQNTQDGTVYFSDNLNPWLWNQLLPDVLDEDDRVAFVGIGTLLNEQLPLLTRKASQRIIFGTGTASQPVSIDHSYKIYCVRGALTAKALGLAEHFAVADGSVLIRKLMPPETRKLQRFAYMPRRDSVQGGWQAVCHELGILYLDPRRSIEDILSHITQAEVLLTESLQGAIVADALRVSWVPIAAHPNVSAFKWQDWCSTIGVEYQPVYLSSFPPLAQRRKTLIPLRALRDWGRHKVRVAELRRVLRDIKPILSRSSCIERLTTQLEERLYQFQTDVRSGAFAVKTQVDG